MASFRGDLEGAYRAYSENWFHGEQFAELERRTSLFFDLEEIRNIVGEKIRDSGRSGFKPGYRVFIGRVDTDSLIENYVPSVEDSGEHNLWVVTAMKFPNGPLARLTREDGWDFNAWPYESPIHFIVLTEKDFNVVSSITFPNMPGTMILPWWVLQPELKLFVRENFKSLQICKILTQVVQPVESLPPNLARILETLPVWSG